MKKHYDLPGAQSILKEAKAFGLNIKKIHPHTGLTLLGDWLRLARTVERQREKIKGVRAANPAAVHTYTPGFKENLKRLQLLEKKMYRRG